MLLQCRKTIAGGTALRHSIKDSGFKPQASFRYHNHPTPPPPSGGVSVYSLDVLTKKLEAQVIQSNLVFYAQSTSTSDTDLRMLEAQRARNPAIKKSSAEIPMLQVSHTFEQALGVVGHSLSQFLFLTGNNQVGEGLFL